MKTFLNKSVYIFIFLIASLAIGNTSDVQYLLIIRDFDSWQWNDRQIDRLTDRQIDRLIDGQIDR